MKFLIFIIIIRIASVLDLDDDKKKGLELFLKNEIS